MTYVETTNRGTRRYIIGAYLIDATCLKGVNFIEYFILDQGLRLAFGFIICYESASEL